MADFGLVPLSDQDALVDERWSFRIRCTQQLLAKHPYVDTVDLSLFLEGFDAAEQWYLRNMGTADDGQVEDSRETAPQIGVSGERF